MEQRLREQAAGDGVELARLHQLLVFDRFLARTDDLRWRTLNEVFEATVAFLDSLLSGCGGTWDPETWEWAGRAADSDA